MASASIAGNTEPEFERAVSFGEYKDGLRGLIHLLKYESVTPAPGAVGRDAGRGDIRVASACGGQVASANWPAAARPGAAASKQTARARVQSGGADRPRGQRSGSCRELEFGADVLLRHRETISQVGLSREERIENMRDAFRVSATRSASKDASSLWSTM